MMENQARQFKHTQDAQENQTDHKRASRKSIEHIGLDRRKKLESSLTGHQSSLRSQTCQFALIVWASTKRVGSGRILISCLPPTSPLCIVYTPIRAGSWAHLGLELFTSTSAHPPHRPTLQGRDLIFITPCLAPWLAQNGHSNLLR